MKFVLNVVVSSLILLLNVQQTFAQIVEPSPFLMQNSYLEADSSISFDQLAFTPGESLHSIGLRFHNFRRHGIEQHGSQVLFVPFSDVVWNGMRGRGWIVFDSLDHAETLVLDFKDEVLDTMYLRLSRSYGLPDREAYSPDGSSYIAMFHDSLRVIEIRFDSNGTNAHIPMILSWAPGHVLGGLKGIDEWRPRSRQWHSLGRSGTLSCFVDTGTPASHLIVVKFVDDSEIKAVKIEAAEKYPTLGYDKYAYGLITYKCECDNQEISVVRILHCSSDDRPIYLYPPNKRYYFTRTVKSGFDKALFDYVCNRLKKSHD